jgi:hypothetical protein
VTRFPDWHYRLESYIHAQSGRAFQYGSHDCCLWVCNAVREMTGIDMAEKFRGRYSTRREARRLLQAAGWFSTIAEDYGLTPIAPALASRGDVIQVSMSVLGLKALNTRDVLVLSDAGLIFAPRKIVPLRAWRV